MDASFGQWLKDRRKALDLTQYDLAERVGCSGETIRKIEAGAVRPSRQVAELIAEALGVPPAERADFVSMARGSGAQGSQPRADTSAVVNPYKGLRAFQEADAPDFFGRETLTAAMI